MTPAEAKVFANVRRRISLMDAELVAHRETLALLMNGLHEDARLRMKKWERDTNRRAAGPHKRSADET